MSQKRPVQGFGGAQCQAQCQANAKPKLWWGLGSLKLKAEAGDRSEAGSGAHSPSAAVLPYYLKRSTEILSTPLHYTSDIRQRSSQSGSVSVHPPNPNLPKSIIHNPKVCRAIPLLPPKNIQDPGKRVIHHTIRKLPYPPFHRPMRDPKETARQPFVAGVGIVAANEHLIGRAVTSGDGTPHPDLGLHESTREIGGLDLVGRTYIHLQPRRRALDSVHDVFVGEIVWG